MKYIYTPIKKQNIFSKSVVGTNIIKFFTLLSFLNINRLFKVSFIYFFLPLFLLFFAGSVKSQNIFSIDFSDTTTFDITCGSVNNAQWSVKYDSCICYTPFLRMETAGCDYIEWDYTINQSGSGTIDDLIYVQYQLNAGPWITDTIINGSDYNAVHHLSGSIYLCYSDILRMRLIMITKSKNDFWSIKNGGETISGSFITYPIYPNPIGLPIDLSSYSIKCSGNGAIISWITASEIKNDYFTIEKSLDAKNWKILSIIPGLLNSNTEHSYYYEDKFENYDQSFYYRLKQTNMDGSYTYYDVLSQTCKSTQGFKFLWINIIDKQLNITFNTDVIEPVTIEIYEISGKAKIIQRHLPVLGENSFSIESIKVNTGIHMVAISQEGNRETKKIMVY